MLFSFHRFDTISTSMARIRVISLRVTWSSSPFTEPASVCAHNVSESAPALLLRALSNPSPRPRVVIELPPIRTPLPRAWRARLQVPFRIVQPAGRGILPTRRVYFCVPKLRLHVHKFCIPLLHQ
ncbi:hypothetical protein BGY98DRAFT_369915 [Russula aff. rugulosa BPL654]|nr:hypothetical protein BGY98DRAFT_369915 [Russula aff. rugulosa BPL654]